MKNSIIIGDSLKNPIFLGGGHEKPIYRGALPKKGEGAWTVCRFRGVAYRKRGELIPQCILWSHSISHEAYII